MNNKWGKNLPNYISYIPPSDPHSSDNTYPLEHLRKEFQVQIFNTILIFIYFVVTAACSTTGRLCC